MTYSDNGRGFDVKAVADCGMGMSNITSRINSLGGIIDITSRPGEGMQATITVSVTGENINNDEEKN
jgi:signal transduction histidine kinase